MKGGQKNLHSSELITGVPEKFPAINLGKNENAQQASCTTGNVFEKSKDDIDKANNVMADSGNSQIPCIVVSQDSDDANDNNNDDTDFEEEKSISESFLR
jgi:predicted transcriptional regulator